MEGPVVEPLVGSPVATRSDNATWYSAGAETGDLSAHRWTVPNGSVVTWTPLPDFNINAVVLEVSFVSEQPPEAWGVHFFDLGASAEYRGGLTAPQRLL